MITIENVQVDLVNSQNALSTKWAIYVIEFEYDHRIMVCHVLDKTVYTGISDMIKKILSPKVESVDLCESLINSEFITVEVKNTYSPEDIDVLLFDKYQLIKSNKSYYPYGYNFLLLVNNALEKRYAFTLHNSIIRNISPSGAKHLPLSKENKRGRTAAPVHKYDKESGLFIETYSSTRNAAKETGISASNINMCCTGYLKSAGGFIWSYDKKDIIDLPSDNRKSRKL